MFEAVGVAKQESVDMQESDVVWVDAYDVVMKLHKVTDNYLVFIFDDSIDGQHDDVPFNKMYVSHDRVMDKMALSPTPDKDVPASLRDVSEAHKQAFTLRMSVTIGMDKDSEVYEQSQEALSKRESA